jgi:hypothetical protein
MVFSHPFSIPIQKLVYKFDTKGSECLQCTLYSWLLKNSLHLHKPWKTPITIHIQQPTSFAGKFFFHKGNIRLYVFDIWEAIQYSCIQLLISFIRLSTYCTNLLSNQFVGLPCSVSWSAEEWWVSRGSRRTQTGASSSALRPWLGYSGLFSAQIK